ncbi:MAG: hypothetical protein ACFE95_11160 [Candidatus Hodarchaeota archaeon]
MIKQLTSLICLITNYSVRSVYIIWLKNNNEENYYCNV